MDDELASEWFAQGERMADIEEAELDLDDAPVPNLRRRFSLWFLAGGAAALMFVVAACMS